MGANAITAITHASNLTPTTGWICVWRFALILILLRFVNSQVAASYQLRALTIFFHFIVFIHYQSGVSELASLLS